MSVSQKAIVPAVLRKVCALAFIASHEFSHIISLPMCTALQVYLRKPDLQEATASFSLVEEEEPAATSKGEHKDPVSSSKAEDTDPASSNSKFGLPASAAISDQFSGLSVSSLTAAASEGSKPGSAAKASSLVLGPEDDDFAEDVAQALHAPGYGQDSDQGSHGAAALDAKEDPATAAYDDADAEADDEDVAEADAEGGVGEGGVARASFEWVDDCDSTVCTVVVQKGQQQQELLVSGGITRQELADLAEDLSAAAAEGLTSGEPKPAEEEKSSAKGAAESQSASGTGPAQHSGSSAAQLLSPSASSQPEPTQDTIYGASAANPILGTVSSVSGSEQTSPFPDLSSDGQQQAGASRAASAPEQLLNEPLGQTAQQAQPTGNSLSSTPMLADVENTLLTPEELSGQVGGTSPTAGLESMTVAELKDICRNNGIKGFSGKAKADLVDYIRDQSA